MNILLVGNYVPDRQESMQRYANAVAAGLRRAGHAVRLWTPRPVLDSDSRGPVSLAKWLGYVDKLVLGTPTVRAHAQWADIVHVCDHSNSPYVPSRPGRPWIVTCHDLLALRGALGEHTDCPASATGRALQALIRRGLQRATRIVAVSEATREDVARLVPSHATSVVVVPPPLNQPFRPLGRDETARRLGAIDALGAAPYALVVGSNLARKNRACAIRVLARLRDRWPGRLVFAGEPLAPELRATAARLGLADRIVDVPGPSTELLEALYNGATCLLFPSRFEGFGWPIVEAQACDCPVVVSAARPMIDVAGGGAIACTVDDDARFADAVLALASDPVLREELKARGRANAAQHDVDAIVARLLHAYERAA